MYGSLIIYKDLLLFRYHISSCPNGWLIFIQNIDLFCGSVVLVMHLTFSFSYSCK